LRDERLRGPQGIQGPPGPKGDQGLQGQSGKDGRDGKDGKDGRDGIDGTAGRDGKDGRDGIDGKDGPIGPMPKHESRGDAIRFEQSEGVWGKWVRLGGHSTGGGIGKDSVLQLIESYLEIGMSQYNKLIDTVGTIKYIGESLPGTASSSASWRIKKVDLTDEDIEITWADGTSEFTKVWDDRASYDYTVSA